MTRVKGVANNLINMSAFREEKMVVALSSFWIGYVANIFVVGQEN